MVLNIRTKVASARSEFCIPSSPDQDIKHCDLPYCDLLRVTTGSNKKSIIPVNLRCSRTQVTDTIKLSVIFKEALSHLFQMAQKRFSRYPNVISPIHCMIHCIKNHVVVFFRKHLNFLNFLDFKVNGSRHRMLFNLTANEPSCELFGSNESS